MRSKYHEPRSPSDQSSHTAASDRLPPIQPTHANSRRHNANTTLTPMQHYPFSSQYSFSNSPRKYTTKSMITTTTVKHPGRGGPVMMSDTPPRPSRTVSNGRSRKTRKLWWAPKRNHIEILSEDGRYKNIHSKIGSLDNIEHQAGGGHVSIRDEHTNWQVSSKIGSLANAKWSPPSPTVVIRSEKIKWDVDAKIGSLEFIDHKPAGGNVAIRDEWQDLSHIAPRVDCGFID